MRFFTPNPEEAWDMMYNTEFRRRFKVPYNLRHFVVGKTREEYVKFIRNMGIKDVCQCPGAPSVKTRKRPNSGDPGQLECAECDLLVFPHMSIYPCDECTEPVLSEITWLPVGVDFFCNECSI